MNIESRQYVAYYRVSTAKQGRSGLGLDAQQRAVADFVASVNGALIAVFTEIESGADNHRPELQAAAKTCRRSKARLVIAKLDRLSRNLAFVANLMDSGVDFVAADMPHASRFELHIRASLAEEERRLISERTKAGLQAARERGTRLGSPTPVNGARVGAKLVSELADLHVANTLPLIRELQRAGLVDYRAIADALNARGVATSRGGCWYASTVRNIVVRGERRVCA